jgi:ribosomal protein S17E
MILILSLTLNAFFIGLWFYGWYLKRKLLKQIAKNDELIKQYEKEYTKRILDAYEPEFIRHYQKNKDYMAKS